MNVWFLYSDGIFIYIEILEKKWISHGWLPSGLHTLWEAGQAVWPRHTGWLMHAHTILWVQLRPAWDAELPDDASSAGQGHIRRYSQYFRLNNWFQISIFHVLEIHFLSESDFLGLKSWGPSHKTHMWENEKALANPLGTTPHSYRQLPGGIYLVVMLTLIPYRQDASHDSTPPS